MSEDQLPAPEGTRFPHYLMLDGVCVPRAEQFDYDVTQRAQEAKEMAVRDDDVFLCASWKSGTHWVWEITNMLLKGKADYEMKSKEVLEIGLMPTETFVAAESPRVFNTHYPLRFLPKQILEKKSKIIFLTRNPKDAAVSMYHVSKMLQGPMLFEGDFSQYLKQRFYIEDDVFYSWFFYVRDWENVMEKHPDLNILELSYEDLKKDLFSNVKKLARFLDVDASDELCNQIVDACSFKNMKAMEKSQINTGQSLYREGFTMYRKGEVGDWKNTFTVAQNEEFDRFYAKKMKGSKLTFLYTL